MAKGDGSYIEAFAVSDILGRHALTLVDTIEMRFLQKSWGHRDYLGFKRVIASAQFVILLVPKDTWLRKSCKTSIGNSPPSIRDGRRDAAAHCPGAEFP